MSDLNCLKNLQIHCQIDLVIYKMAQWYKVFFLFLDENNGIPEGNQSLKLS